MPSLFFNHGCVLGITCNEKSVSFCIVSIPLKKARCACTLVFAIIIADLPSSRKEHFSAEVTDLLMHEVKDHKQAM